MTYLFTKKFNDQLFVGPAGNGELWLVLSAAEAGNEIPLDTTLADPRVTYVHSAAPVPVTEENAQEFVQTIRVLVAQTVGAERGYVWLRDPADITAATAAVMGLASDGTRVQNSLTGATIVSGLQLVILSGTTLALEGETLQLSNGEIRFEGSSAPHMQTVAGGAIPFSGTLRGGVQFTAYVAASSLKSTWFWGFEFFYSGTPSPVGELLPLADSVSADFVQLAVTLNPSDPCNDGTAEVSALAFTGSTLRDNQIIPTVLDSYFRTTAGEAIALVPVPGTFGTDPYPARLGFNRGVQIDESQERFHTSPGGDFTPQIAGSSDHSARDLMCGLQGTELIAFRPKSDTYEGDRMRFEPRQPAYSPLYPFALSSPTGPQMDPTQPLLEGQPYVTSWMNVIATDGSALPYVAQPKGLTLYGRDNVVNPSQPTLLGMVDPSVKLPPASSNAFFPLVPYSGVNEPHANVADFELQIIGPTRRKIIGEKSPGVAPSRTAVFRPGTAADSAPYNTTTPTGFLVTVEDGVWKKILLGQNVEPAKRQMYFCNPPAPLQQAFQTNQLFAVIANARFTGAFASGGTGNCGAGAAFYNEMNIADWFITATVGNNRYNDYRNVVIVKGMKGALYDVTADQPSGLVMNPDQWTQKSELGAPSDIPPGGTEPGPPDANELTVLSAWLQDYFEAARVHPESKYFRKFNEIARNPNWTGVLILRTNITVPSSLAGIMAGVRDRDAFNAHHFGIEITQVTNTPGQPLDVDGSSSMFGLIYYSDPAFVAPVAAGEKPQAVPPPGGIDYEFRLLTLRVLFENTAIVEFQSWAQLTINTLFDSRVKTIEGGSNNTIILTGTYQEANGVGIYNLGTTDAVRCYLSDNNVINKIEITSAQMTTQSATSSRFSLSGFLDFAVVADRSGQPFDVFSFGSEYTIQNEKIVMKNEPRKGLACSGLSIDMLFASDPLQNKYTFNATNVRFDVTTSTPRATSIFINFALGLQRLISGDKESTPANNGFASLITDATLTGVEGGTWYGLVYQLNLGTPGNLAGSVGLTSGLLTAWAPKSGPDAYSALVGLRLPGTGGGAKLISLQNVLKLSIGQLVLTFDRSTNSFLLMLTEIALRFLGLLKIPPSGSSTFFLFGNPKSGGKPSGLGWYAMYNAIKPKPPQQQGQ